MTMMQQWQDVEQELIKRFSPNYHNYPMSVEFYIRMMKRTLNQVKNENDDE